MLPTVSTTKVVQNGTTSLRTSYKVSQRPPYDLLLPYSSFVLTRGSGPRSASSNYDSQFSAWWLQCNSGDIYEETWQAAKQEAMNASVVRFNEKRGKQAALGVAMAEASKSLTMVTLRLTQLVKAASALRKGRFLEVAETLGLTVKSKPLRKFRSRTGILRWTKHPVRPVWYPSPKTSASRRKTHEFSNLWLEYSFGWAPTVSDISTALGVLSTSIAYNTPIKARGRANVNFVRNSDVRTLAYDKPDPVYGWDAPIKGYTQYRCTQTGVIGCESGGVLTATNPNLDLAKRLGLTNLPAIALELVPFSFVANWFFNLEEYFGQFSPDYGISISRCYYTLFAECNSAYKVTRSDTGVIVNNQAGNHKAVSVIRTVGSLPSVSLTVRPEYRTSIRRAITQSALLIKLFTSKR